MKKYSIMLVALTITSSLFAVSKGPDFHRIIGATTQDCRSLETDIQAIEKKKNKTEKDIKHLNAQKYNFEKIHCDLKLKTEKK